MHAFQCPFRPEEDYRSSWKLVYNFNQMFCYRDYQLTTIFNQQNEKSTSNYTTKYGLEALHLFRDRERLWLRALDYKNHRIFTLRCIHKDLIPVSIKLKSTLKTEMAKKIVRKVEKDLLQARFRSIKSILDNVGKQTELCRSQGLFYQQKALENARASLKR